jgi:hypothetical protein
MGLRTKSPETDSEIQPPDNVVIVAMKTKHKVSMVEEKDPKRTLHCLMENVVLEPTGVAYRSYDHSLWVTGKDKLASSQLVRGADGKIQAVKWNYVLTWSQPSIQRLGRPTMVQFNDKGDMFYATENGFVVKMDSASVNNVESGTVDSSQILIHDVATMGTKTHDAADGPAAHIDILYSFPTTGAFARPSQLTLFGNAMYVAFKSGQINDGAALLHLTVVPPADAKTRTWKNLGKGTKVTRVTAVTNAQNMVYFASGVNVYRMDKSSEVIQNIPAGSSINDIMNDGVGTVFLTGASSIMSFPLGGDTMGPQLTKFVAVDAPSAVTAIDKGLLPRASALRAQVGLLLALCLLIAF